MLTKTRWKIEFNDSLVTPRSYNTTILKFMLIVHELKPKKKWYLALAGGQSII